MSLAACVSTVADALASATSPDDIYQAALQGIRQAVGVDRASVLLFDVDGVMRFKAWSGLSEEYRRAVEGHTPWTRGQIAPPPIVVPDVRADGALGSYLPVFLKEGIRALAFIPLLLRQQTIGKFMLYWSEPHVPASHAVDAALTVGALIGLAVERARQNAEHERHQERMERALTQEAEARERLTRLAEGAQRLLTLREPGSIVQEVLALARNAIPADGYAVWRHEGDFWRVVASTGLDPEFTSACLAADGRRVLDGPIVAADVQQSEILDVRREAYRAAGIRSLVSVPLEIRGRPSGTIAYYYRQPHRPSEIELRVEQALGHLAAAAISSAELYAEQESLRHEAVRRAERSAFLAEVSAGLGSLDYEHTLQTIASLMVPRFAHWCVVDLVEGDALRRLAVAHTDPAKVEFAREVQRLYPPKRDDRGGVWSVIRTGEPALYPHIGDELLARGARDPEHLAMLREIGVRSAMLVPLKRGTEVFGVVTLVLADDTRAYDEEDFEFAQELARRAAFAIENARLFRQAQEANRAKDEFLAALSHELRTPLNAILGWASILRAKPEGQVDRGLDVIYRNAKVQTELVDDLLDASRIVSGRMSIDLKDVPLRPILEAAVETIMPAASEKDITIASKLPPPALRIRGDAARLQQVFWNILNNAVKFTPRGGRVTISTDSTTSDVSVQVTDTGAGIRSESLPFIFDRFKQADSSSTRRYRGLGLGLTLSRQLTEMHGGRIVATSPGPGRGATFMVTLPLVERTKTVPAAPPPPAHRDALTGLSILAVDDDPDSLEVLTSVLRMHKAAVVGASSAVQALEMFKHARPDLVISDIAMPDHDGYWLLARAREAAQDARQVPWIALTAFANSAARDRALAAGFAAHLSKPIDPDELVSIIHAIDTAR